MRGVSSGLVLLAVLLSSAAGVAQDRDRRHEERRREAPQWRGDIRHFEDHDRDFWRRGRWAHEWHGGRFGWWWVVGPSWYYYPVPVYPYPDPYLPPSAGPPVVPGPPVGTRFWYYCDNPPGYYPYVAQCGVPWRAVPAGSPQP